MILGLTGPVQNGKIQLAHVFEECGWKFYDLNDVIYANRERGSMRHAQYHRLFPGSIDDEGVETAAFYRDLTGPMYKLLLSEDIPMVASAARLVCEAARKYGDNVVVSWEYLSRISDKLPIDKLLLFGSDRRIWFDRMKVRAAELGWSDPSDEKLEAIVAMLDVEPSTIERDARSAFSDDRIVRIDVSADDWGAAELRKFLQSVS